VPPGEGAITRERAVARAGEEQTAVVPHVELVEVRDDVGQVDHGLALRVDRVEDRLLQVGLGLGSGRTLNQSRSRALTLTLALTCWKSESSSRSAEERQSTSAPSWRLVTAASLATRRKSRPFSLSWLQVRGRGGARGSG